LSTVQNLIPSAQEMPDKTHPKIPSAGNNKTNSLDKINMAFLFTKLKKIPYLTC
jgi:hypothetical protein